MIRKSGIAQVCTSGGGGGVRFGGGLGGGDFGGGVLGGGDRGG